MANADVLPGPVDLPMPEGISIHEQWARYRVRKRLAKVYNYAPRDQLSLAPTPLPTGPVTPEHLPELPELKPTQDLPPEMRVCIIGAGAAGLFTAMIFDWLKSQKSIPSLNISYDIVEAAGQDRLGGRLYTHQFPGTQQYPAGPHDYYDVGAMRFPDNPVMKKTFDLFTLLGMQKQSPSAPNGVIIPYYMDGTKDGSQNPTYFNDIHYANAPPLGNPIDPYDMNSQTGMPIPDNLLSIGPDATINKVIDTYREAFKTDPKKGWDMLMDADNFTARDFLLLPPVSQLKTVRGSEALKDDQGLKDDDNPISGPGFNFNTVEWLETFGQGTRGYQQAFSELVLDSLDFDYPGMDTNYFCIEGGANLLAQNMAKAIKGEPQFNTPVTSVRLGQNSDPNNVTVGTANGDLPNKYAAVFNSATLGATERMDLTQAKLNYGTKQAIRTLNYGESCKVGIRFKKPWWREAPFNVTKGGLGKTDLPLRICVYPSYNIYDPLTEASVLLCSYTWQQDAARISSLISRETPNNEDMLKTLLFRNLALLHSTPETYDSVLDLIRTNYITHHAWSWYDDPYAVGAFAFFGPSQFKEVWPDITTPSADGKLLFIGEAASVHHAWVVGALESALRGVYQFLFRYATVYREFNQAKEFMEQNTEAPFDLPWAMETETAGHQVLVSELRAAGLKDPA
ncbi:MAG: ssDNA endodeoxyribonuclease [Chaenotheca gracillima]|nr:MAG: ssDNA endodeoxyribonuclease [Chaenotheca gracillima]